MAEQPSEEYIIIPIAMARPYRWSRGQYIGRLFKEIRDNKRLVANRCPKCQQLLYPPQMVCGKCHVRASDQFEEISDKGTVVQYTLIKMPLWDPHLGARAEPDPHPTATILLDSGVYTMMARLEETDPEKIKAGMRVQAVWKEETGEILYFRTIEQ